MFLLGVLFLMCFTAATSKAQSQDSAVLVSSFKVSTMDTITVEVDEGTTVEFQNFSVDNFIDDFSTDAVVRVSEVVKVNHHRAKVVTPALVRAGRYQMTKEHNTIKSTNLNKSPIVMSGGSNIEDKIERVIIRKPEGVNVKVKVREQ